MAKLKLNQKIIDDSEKLIRAGNYVNVVCNYLGIDESTWYRWIKKGEEDNKKGINNIYCKFFKSIKRAESIAEIKNVNVIQMASQEDWKASAWYLERKYFDRWGRKEGREITGKDGGSVKVEEVKNSLINKLNNIKKSE
jgi:hypothetical protein